MHAPDENLLSAPELAEAYDITPRALRFYETKGLLKPRRIGARRIYGRRDRARLQLILRGKHLGFSLAEVAEYLKLYDADPTQVTQLKRLEELLDERIEALEAQRGALETTLDELGEIRQQVMDALNARGAHASPLPEAAERRFRPRIRPKSANGRGDPPAASQGDD